MGGCDLIPLRSRVQGFFYTFLQFVNKDQEFKILPIAVSGNSNYELFGRKIIEIAKELNRKICIICSSDFTHFGMTYGYMPFSENVKENLEKLDRDAIATMISACKAIGGERKVKLLNYYTSGDVVGDYGNAVGYASIVIE